MALAAIAAGLVLVAARLGFPYTLVLVAIGFALGVVAPWVGLERFPASVAVVLRQDVFFDAILPPIVFEAAIHIDARLLRAHLGLVSFLIVVGVVFTTVFAGVAVAYLVGLPILAGLLLGAILSPTDPVAVVDLFRRLKVPEGLSTIVEGESLFNDAVGVVMFLVVLAVVRGGVAPYAVAALDGLRLVGVGILVGVVAALGLRTAAGRLDHGPAMIAVSIGAAYASSLAATALGGSGIVAAAIAGLAFGNWVVPRAIGPEVRRQLTAAWEAVVYLANSVVFLTMGLLFGLAHLERFVALIVVVFAVLTAGRWICVYAYRLLSAGGGHGLPGPWYPTIALAGIRGAIPIVLALSLAGTAVPLSTPTVTEIVAATLGAAFLSMPVGNLAADAYVRRASGRMGGPPPGGEPRRSGG